MIKAIFIDFYGTLVHEDGKVIKRIVDIIAETGQVISKSEVSSFWWSEFENMFHNSYGDTFETQRILEYKSLANTLNKYQSTANPQELSNMMFEHWRKPPIFEETKEFFSQCSLPIYIVSNIDNDDIKAAIDYHKLMPAGVFTSENAKSYKPRKELFVMALKAICLQPSEVLHIGDSISSDVNGAGSLGINTIWVNRSDKEVPMNIIAVSNLLEVLDTEYFR